MNASERRENIKNLLAAASSPISASQLASNFCVSRQIVVGDIALLRASGHNILATPRGYLIEKQQNTTIYSIACRHNNDRLKDELYSIIDCGGTIIDVTVEHPIYGELCAPLHLQSRFDADQFLNKISSQNVKPLSELTDGLHLHKISCPNDEIYHRIIERLQNIGILFDESTSA